MEGPMPLDAGYRTARKGSSVGQGVGKTKPRKSASCGPRKRIAEFWGQTGLGDPMADRLEVGLGRRVRELLRY